MCQSQPLKNIPEFIGNFGSKFYWFWSGITTTCQKNVLHMVCSVDKTPLFVKSPKETMSFRRTASLNFLNLSFENPKQEKYQKRHTHTHKVTNFMMSKNVRTTGCGNIPHISIYQWPVVSRFGKRDANSLSSSREQYQNVQQKITACKSFMG